MVRLRNSQIQVIRVDVDNPSFIHMMIHCLNPDGVIDVRTQLVMQMIADPFEFCLKFRSGLI